SNNNIAIANGNVNVNGNNIHSSANHNMSSTYNETLTATPAGAKSVINLTGTSYHQGANYPGHSNHSNNLQLNASGLGHLASHNGSTTTLAGSNNELQLTMNDLSQWLEVFETGIKTVRSS
ncbi:hypothetical protein BG015_008814, partial [Linnemannia schmuckeri]